MTTLTENTHIKIGIKSLIAIAIFLIGGLWSLSAFIYNIQYGIKEIQRELAQYQPLTRMTMEIAKDVLVLNERHSITTQRNIGNF